LIQSLLSLESSMVNAPQNSQPSKNRPNGPIGQESPTIVTPQTILECLRDQKLLEMTQLNDLFLAETQGRFPAGADVGRELLKRGWITPYQANRLLQGRGNELVVGPYIVLERLGEGGAGQVFKARHSAMGRIVALKVIRKDLLGDAEALARFQREVRVISQLTHPNIIQAYDAGSVGSTYFLAMEYGEGTDLHKMLKERGSLPVPQACNYMRQAALALQYIHEKGLVHRDIKPSNMLITGLDSRTKVDASGRPAGGMVKLLDLGLARPLGAATNNPMSMVTEANTALGTPDFMAPEQALNFHGADIRADIYSLGCTLFAALAGRVPFPGNSLAEKLIRHQQMPPPDLAQLRPDVPHALADAVIKMLAKHPADRFQTPAEVAVLLSHHARCSGPLPKPVHGEDISTSSTVEDVLTANRMAQLGMSGRTERMGTTHVNAKRPLPLLWIGIGAGVVLVFGMIFVLAVVLLMRGSGKDKVEKNGTAASKSKSTANETMPFQAPKLDAVKGSVILVNGTQRRPASRGTSLAEGQSLETSTDGTAVLTWPDGSRVEIGPGAVVSTEAKAETSPKRLAFRSLANVRVHVPATETPLALATPQIKARIVQGRGQLRADRDATCFRVDEGNATAIRVSDGKEVTLGTDQYALVAPKEERPQDFKATSRAVGWKTVDDFEHGNAANMWGWNSTVTFVPGRVGKKAAQLEFDVKQFQPTGVFWNFAPPQDFSSAHYLFFWFRGANTGCDVAIYLQNHMHQGPGHITYTFKDNFTGWRQFRVPFSAFQLTKNKDGSLPPKFDFHRIGMITIQSFPGAKGSYGLDQFEVLDHELLADPPEK
jgi:serine/threonine protein kinase